MVHPGMRRSVSGGWTVQKGNEVLIAALKGGKMTGQSVPSFHGFGDKRNITCPFSARHCYFKRGRKEQDSNYHTGQPLRVIAYLFLPTAGSHLLLAQNTATLGKRRWILSLCAHWG